MSSSSSSTRQDVYQLDNRRVIGQGGISAEGGSNVSIQTLDGDVINRAFQFGGTSLQLVGGSVAEALGFGGKALDAALNANADALAFADANASRNSAMAYDVLGNALASSDAALSQAFRFGNNAMGAAFDTLGSTQNLVKDAYADAKGRGALTDKMIMGAIAAMAVVAFAAIKK